MVGLTELDIETLVTETERLLSIDTDELYATLGAQIYLLGQPISAAGMMTYLSSVGSTIDAALCGKGEGLTKWRSGVECVHETLKARGREYMAEVKDELHEALCHDEILAWSDEVNPSIIRILITLVSGALRVPRMLDAISALTVAIVLKSGLRNFCA